MESHSELLKRAKHAQSMKTRWIQVEPALLVETIALNERELATTLAALRYWQDTRANSPFRHSYNEYFGDDVKRIEPLNDSEIDSLCERINGGL